MGYNFKLQNLYPKIQWPVSANTSMISPLIKWNHDNNWFVGLYKTEHALTSGERSIGFNFKDADVAYMVGHVIDGRILFPATGYLTIIWESLSLMTGVLLSDMKVVFEDVKFHRATNIRLDSGLQLITTIQKSTGLFEVSNFGLDQNSSKKLFKPDCRSRCNRSYWKNSSSRRFLTGNHQSSHSSSR